MTRYLNIVVCIAVAITFSQAYPVEEIAKESVSQDKSPQSEVVDKVIEPEVHEPVPAVAEVPQSDEPAVPKEPEQPVGKDVGAVGVSFEALDQDKSGYLDAAEWEAQTEKKKFEEVDVNADARITPEEFKGVPAPVEPQENVNDVYVPAEISDQQPVDKPVESPVDDLGPVLGRSAEGDVVVPAAVEGEDVVAPVAVDTVIVPDGPVVALVPEEEAKPIIIVDEPIAAASAEEAVAIIEGVVPPKEVVDELVPVEEVKQVSPEERADVSGEDGDEQVSEQKDPIISDEVKSEEVKSEEVKSDEVKSEEVKSQEDKFVQPEEVKKVEAPKELAKAAVEESDKKPQEEQKVKDEEKVKEEEKVVVEDKVKEVVKVEEPVKSEVVQPEVSKDSSPSNTVTV